VLRQHQEAPVQTPICERADFWGTDGGTWERPKALLWVPGASSGILSQRREDARSSDPRVHRGRGCQPPAPRGLCAPHKVCDPVGSGEFSPDPQSSRRPDPVFRLERRKVPSLSHGALSCSSRTELEVSQPSSRQH
jgi:hypothetical protein